MTKDCSIAEDLLPLYVEGLLQEETEAWLEEHLQGCSHCRELVELSEEPLTAEKIAVPDEDELIGKINFKLTVYQILFIAISLVIAMKTSLVNNSFGFILTYTVLGLVTYLFYRRFLFVLAIAFFPMFLWAFADFRSFETMALASAATIAALHLIFALAGAAIGWLVLKLKTEGD